MVLLILPISFLLAQETGKIRGEVIDKSTGEPLSAVNVIVEDQRGNTSGVATDQNGKFNILNLQPGTYTLRAQMIGYKPYVIEEIELNVNRTRYFDIALTQGTVEGEEITVTAEQIYLKKDQTSSIKNINTDDIMSMPIENIDNVINQQAGIVAGHFRGGRSTEASYMIDGLQVDNSFGGVGHAIDLEPESVENLEIITGTFNAEYGRAMSGVVNMITKEGDSEEIEGHFSTGFSNYITVHDDIFIGLEPFKAPTRNLSQDYKAQIGGPLFSEKLTFLYNIRYQDDNGYLNGYDRYSKIDFNDYTGADSSDWHIEHTGPHEYMSVQTSKSLSMMSKLTFKPISGIKLSGLFTYNDDQGRGYDHDEKYNPDYSGKGYNTSYMLAFNLNHMLTDNAFYDLKISLVEDKNQDYKFKDPLDDRYVHPRYTGIGSIGFITGGIEGPGKSTDIFTDLTVKYDFSWQISANHNVKSGIQYIKHTIDRNRVDIRNKWEGTKFENMSDTSDNGYITFPYFEPEIDPITETDIGVYEVHPFEYSGYIQDKMEFEEMVINAGLRYDAFNPDFHYPTDRRNPGNQLNLPDSMMSDYKDADIKQQLSPRLGLAYQVGEIAVLRFSYGHFFQMPQMSALYANNKFRVPTNDYETVMGNTQLEAQKTVSYELGLWQELTDNLALETTVFYKDIYDLLSTRIIATYNQIRYGLYTNKDYGNTRGLELKLVYNYDRFFADVNYTLQYTRGNADDPEQTFTRAGESMDPIVRLIPMSWDQRHTFNFTLGYRTELFGTTIRGSYNSGTPYTYEPLPDSPLSQVNLYPNNAWQPVTYNVDTRTFYNINLSENYDLQVFMNIYNLFDWLRAVDVYDDTGQPYDTIIRENEKESFHCDFTDVYDQYRDPSDYANPRRVKIGMEVKF